MDFTDLIHKKYMRNSFLFNPSIAWVEGDLYLISVRSFLRTARQRVDHNPDLIHNRNSPWRGGGKSDRWWWTTNPSGEDMTYFALFEIKGNKIQKIRDFDLQIDGSDARVFRDSSNRFIVTYNVFIDWDTNITLKDGRSCNEEDWCMLMQQSILSLSKDHTQLTKIDTSDPALCLNISADFEKNCDWAVART